MFILAFSKLWLEKFYFDYNLLINSSINSTSFKLMLFVGQIVYFSASLKEIETNEKTSRLLRKRGIKYFQYSSVEYITNDFIVKLADIPHFTIVMSWRRHGDV